MKKLNLNKNVVARLNNPENIYGGLPQTYLSASIVDYQALSQLKDEKGITGCNSGPNTVCILTKMWNCPGDPSYILTDCNHPQSHCACAFTFEC